MADELKLGAQKRILTGRKVKRLRREGWLPGNIYGRGVKSLAVAVPMKEFAAIWQRAGETNVVSLVIDKEAKLRPVLIHNVQQDPVTDDQLHVDFHEVDLTKKVTVMVPLEVFGESPAVAKGGVLVKLVNELEVEALPADLPDKIAVDVSGLTEINQGIALKQVPVDAAKVKLTAENMDELVVKIEPPTKEEEPAPAPAGEPAPAEPEKEAESVKKAEPEKKPQTPDQGKPPAAKKS